DAGQGEDEKADEVDVRPGGQCEAGGVHGERVDTGQHGPELGFFLEYAFKGTGEGVEQPQGLAFPVQGLEGGQHQHVSAHAEGEGGQQTLVGAKVGGVFDGAVEDQLRADDDDGQQQALDEEVAVAGEEAEFAAVQGCANPKTGVRPTGSDPCF